MTYYWRRPYPGSDIDPGVGNVCKTYSMMVRYPLHTQTVTFWACNPKNTGIGIYRP